MRCAVDAASAGVRCAVDAASAGVRCAVDVAIADVSVRLMRQVSVGSTRVGALAIASIWSIDAASVGG